MIQQSYTMDLIDTYSASSFSKGRRLSTVIFASGAYTCDTQRIFSTLLAKPDIIV